MISYKISESELSEKYLCEAQVQYKIWLSMQSKKFSLYLAIKEALIIIGFKNCNQKENIVKLISDFIGFNEQQINQHWIKLTLNFFEKKKKLFRAQKRYLSRFHVYLFREDYSSKELKQLKDSFFELATNGKYKNLSKSPKLMIYFNPNSGSNSKKHLKKILKFLSYTNFTYDFLQTQRKSHCKEHIDSQLSLDEYHGIVIVSGDGLMHEFVNSKAVGVVPVTHVPAGSGNAFAKYQMAKAGEACQDEEAMFLAIKGQIRKFNLAQLTLQKIEQPIYSFLSLEWCFMADIDLNSEFLRFLGGLRFQIYGFWRLIKIKRYQGRLTYSINQTNLPALQEQIADSSDFMTQNKMFLHQIITFIPWISESYEISPLLQIEDQAMDMQKIPEEAGRWQLMKYMLNCQSGDHFDRQKKSIKEGYKFEWDKIKSFRLQPNGIDRGVFGIDGQMYESQKIQAKISDKKLLAFS